jgi:hypothetical protein
LTAKNTNCREGQGDGKIHQNPNWKTKINDMIKTEPLTLPLEATGREV